MPELEKNYDGNDLESAMDEYQMSVDGWAEIIRYEDGHNSCREQTLQAISKLRTWEKRSTPNR